MAEERNNILVTPERTMLEVGNLRNSTGKTCTSSGREKILLPHYLRASTGSCHDFCKYGRKHAIEALGKHRIRRRVTITVTKGEYSVNGASVPERQKKPAVKLRPSLNSETQLPNNSEIIKQEVPSAGKKKEGYLKQDLSPTKQIKVSPRQASAPAKKIEVSSRQASPPAEKIEVSPRQASPPVEKIEASPRQASPPAEKIEVCPSQASPPTEKIEVPPGQVSPPAQKIEVSPRQASPPAEKIEVCPRQASPPTEKLEVKVSPRQVSPPAEKIEVSPGQASPPAEKIEICPRQVSPPTEKIAVSPRQASPPAEKIEVSPRQASLPAKKIEVSPRQVVSPAKKIEVSPRQVVSPVKKIEVSPKQAVSPSNKIKVSPKQAVSPAKKIEVSPKQAVSPARKIKVSPKQAVSPAKKIKVYPKQAVTPAKKIEVSPKQALPSARKIEVSTTQALSPAKKLEASTKQTRPPAKRNNACAKPGSPLKPNSIAAKQCPLSGLSGGMGVKRNSDLKIVKKTATSEIDEKKIWRPKKASVSPKPSVSRDLSLNTRKYKIEEKKAVMPPDGYVSPKPSVSRVLSSNTRKYRSLKAVSPLKNQKKVKKAEPKLANLVKEKTLYVIGHPESRSSEAAQNGTHISQSSPSLSSSVLSSSLDSPPSPLLHSHVEEKNEESESMRSEADDSISEYEETENENQVETLNMEDRKSGRGAVYPEKTDCPQKLNFRRGRVVNLQSENNGPVRLRFRQRRVAGENDTGSKSFRRRRVVTVATVGDTDSPKPESEKVVLRHQDMQGKKDAQGLFNNVIEETASKLVETRKSKVKALVGAFETVISLQEGKPSTS